MKTSWLNENMWIVFFVFVFILGGVFIVWMGNTRLDNDKPSLAKQMVNREITQFIPVPGASPRTLSPSTDTLIMPVVSSSPSLNESPSPSSIENENELSTKESNDLCPTLLIKRGNQYMLFNKNMPEEVGENPLFFDTLDQYKNYVETQRTLYNQKCPVLFLQEEVNAQGENVYRLRETESSGNVDPILLGSIQDYFLSKTNVMPKFGPPTDPQAFNKPPTNNGISLDNYGVSVEQLTQEEVSQHPPLVEYKDANRDNKPYNQGYHGFDPTNQYVGQYTVLDKIHDSTMSENKDGLSNNPMDPNWGGVVFTADKVASGIYDENNVQPSTVPSVLQE